MSSVKFYLNSKSNSDGEKLLLMYFRFDRKQVVVSTNELVLPSNWDNKKQRVSSKHDGYSSFNDLLLKYKAETTEIFNNRKYLNLSILPKDLKVEFEKLIKSDNKSTDTVSKKKNRSGLVSFIDSQIKSQLNSKNENTLKTYRRCKGILEEFENKTWGKTIEFSDVDLDFYLKWKDFVIVNCGLQNNSINKYTGIIKYFMGEAADRGLHQNFIYRSRKFNTQREDVDTIYLTNEDLAKLLNLDLSSNPRLEKVRDLFYIGTKTGFRFSVLSSLKDENIDKHLEYFFVSKTEKTLVSLTIPIHPEVKALFLKYKELTGSYIPPSISNQKMNEYLKEIGLLCGLTEEISLVKKVGNTRKQTNYPKYELITCHTARRSFATNLYLEGTPIYEIMAMTGHKTEKSFLTYIKITQREYAKKLKDRWSKNSINNL